MRTTKQNHCFKSRTRREYYTCDITFHESSLYYKRLQKPSPSSLENGKSSESELEYEPIKAVPRQPSATALRKTQKTRLKNLESNLGPRWQLPEGFKRKREKTNTVEKERKEGQFKREEKEDREGTDHAMMINVGPRSILEAKESVESEEWRSAISPKMA